MATKPTGVPGLKIKADHVDELRAALALLTKREVLVGFPESTADRQDDDGTTTKGVAGLGAKSDITNAQLGYIHDNGEPSANIPQRQFMRPGIEEGREVFAAKLLKIGKRVLRRASPIEIEQGFTEVGIAAQFALRRKINEGVPPPLSDRTLRARAAKGRKGAKKELELRGQGVAPSTQLAKPLIDTGQLRNAINFVIRAKKDRK